MHRELGEALAKKGDTVAAAEQFRLAKALPVDGTIPKRIRVGGKVMNKKLIYHELPAYPDDAKAAHVTGVVRLEVVIGTDGSVAAVSVLSGDTLLAPAAVDAVRKWRFQPPLVNGSPVELLATVEVSFKFYRPLNL